MQLGEYAIEGVLGRGGAGVVYRARARDGRAVAVKLLHRSEVDAAARFDRERRLLAELGLERGFVPILDEGTAPEGRFFVMPFLAGGTLRARFEKGPLAVEEAVALGRALARSVGAAHRRGIVHRDLKPENVLFDEGGRLLVADLGIAKHVPGSALRSATFTQSGAFMGTIGYMAPEQMEDAKNVGPAADVFALGVMLYEALGGARPFDGVSPLDCIEKIRLGRATPLAELRPGVPRWLAQVVERSMLAEPLRRFPDALALEAALGRPRRSAARKAAIILAALVGVGAPGALLVRSQRPASLAAACRESGLARALAGDLDGALRDLGRAIELDPKAAETWYTRGRVKEGLEDLDGAIADYSEAVRLDPRSPSRVKARFALRVRKNDLAGALADLDLVLALDPRDKLAWHDRGSLLAVGGDLSNAIAAYERAAEIDPWWAANWDGLAQARVNAKEHAAAIEAASRAIALEPSHADFWNTRGCARRESGDTFGAVADFTRAIALEPALALAWKNRGGSKDRLYDTAGAIADFERFIELSDDDGAIAEVKNRIAILRRRR